MIFLFMLKIWIQKLKSGGWEKQFSQWLPDKVFILQNSWKIKLLLSLSFHMLGFLSDAKHMLTLISNDTFWIIITIWFSCSKCILHYSVWVGYLLIFCPFPTLLTFCFKNKYFKAFCLWVVKLVRLKMSLKYKTQCFAA